MIRTALAATALLFAAVPAAAQTQQEALDARYDRALAAGYKALMLCSAIALAERIGTTRTPESVMQWELTGIQEPQAAIIAEMPYALVRRPTGQIAHVAVAWAEDLPPRLAAYFGSDKGCSVLPIGAPEDASHAGAPLPVEEGVVENLDLALGVMPAPERDLPPIEAAFSDKYGNGRTTAVVVRQVENGNATANFTKFASGFDKYTPQRTWSVAKSIAATLVGAAVHQGEAKVDEPIGLTYWISGHASDPRNAITIDHSLRMATGRYSDTPGNRTDPLYFGGSTVEETTLNWPVIHKPGTVFRYANNATLLAVKAIGRWLALHPPHEFFDKLGMKATVAESDIRGDYVLSSQVWSTAWDLAALGQLYLNDGVWDGTRILPEGWVKYVTTPSGPQPATGTFGYGAGFWLLNREEGVPPDTFAAIGNRGQYVVIVPSRRVVIVRRGEDPAGAGFDIAAFTRDVLAALAK